MTNLETRSVLDAYAEGQRYFMGEGKLNNALARLVADLKEHEVDYLVIGELIKIRGLSRDFAEKLDPYVRRKYLELAEAMAHGRKSSDRQ
jgi:sugar phosphate isomerase/epimerase